MRRDRLVPWRSWDPTWFPLLATAGAVAALTAVPAPLLPLARGFRDLCARYPILTVLTHHLPPVPVALLLGLVGLALASGGAAGTLRLVGTRRFNRRLERCVLPPPPRLERAGRRLGLAGRLTCLADPAAAAFCYGFRRPRIAVTTGLVDRLDDEELVAVLAHERHHLHRRDPLRYLALHAAAAAAFMFPVIPAIRQRLETRVELAADRAALAVVPRGALAGALLAVLNGREAAAVGAAGLSATEARIAHLAGAPLVPPIPARPLVASLALLALIVAAIAVLATSAHLVAMVCRLCVGAT